MKNVLQLQPFYLNQPLGASDTTIQVRGLKDSRGTAITAMPSGVTEIVVTIEPKSANNQEIISFTGITDNGNGVVTLTGVTRNLSPTDATVVLSATVPHANNSICIVSDSPQAMKKVVVTDETATITAVHTFSVSPIVPTATSAGEPVNKSQLDLAVLGTVPPSSTTVLGAVRVATDPTKTLGNVSLTIASPCVAGFSSHGLTANDTVRFTTTGALPTGVVAGTTYYVIATGLTSNTFQFSTTAGGSAVNTSGGQSGTHTLYRTTPYGINDQDYRFGLNTFGVDSGTANAHVVTLPAGQPTAYASGQVFSYRVNVTNTTAVTVNVAGLGIKTIKKLDGATDLVAGDLVAGQIIEIEYNATSGFFMLLSPVATPPVTYLGYGDGSDGSGTLDGSTTVFGLVPAGNVYTMTRDLYCINLTINTGVTLNTAGYRLFGTGTLTGNGTAKVLRNGANGGNGGNGGNGTSGSGGTAGTAGTAGSALSAGSIGNALAGSNGGAGGSGGTFAGTGGAGNAGTSASTLSNSVGSGSPASSAGVAGGAGGGTGAGASAGSASSNAVTNPVMMPRVMPFAINMHFMSGATVGYMGSSNSATGGAGGSGGGGGTNEGGTSGTGGGGGGGGAGGSSGGIVVVAFKNIVSPSSSFIQALGGNGGTGGNGGNGVNNGGAQKGGGGGGGSGGTGGTGGVVVCIYQTFSGTTLVESSACAGGAGGAGGTGGASVGTGSGVAGSNGNTGTTGGTGKLYLVNM